MNLNRLYEWARLRPAKIALVHNGIAVDYLTFARAAEANRVFFEGKNIPAKGPAVVAVGNVADSWFIVLALQALGFDTICAPTPEAVRSLNIKTMSCLVVTEAEQAGKPLDASIAMGAPLVVVPRMRPQEIAPEQLPLQARMPGGHILYTSGTTGENKKLLLDASTTEKRTARQITIRAFTHDMVFHCGGFGLWSAAGWSLPIDAWHMGGTAVIDQRADSLRHFLEHGVNRAFMTPVTLRELLDLRGADARPIEHFVLAVGTGFLSLELAEKAYKTFSREIRIAYGATECPLMASADYAGEEDLHWLLPVEDRILEIVDENDRICPTGEQGKIRVKLTGGDCTSYLDDAETSAEFFRHGYFYPGDLGVFRDDGKFRILGRAGDVLNIQGSKVPVAPIEAQLQMRLGVRAVCLFAGLSDGGKDELVVVIEGDKPPEEAQVAAIRGAFGKFESIRFEVMKTFPRTTGGTQKIMREELRKLVFPHGSLN